MAYNLGRILRSLLGAGKPRYLAVLAERLCFLYFIIVWRYELKERLSTWFSATSREHRPAIVAAA